MLCELVHAEISGRDRLERIISALLTDCDAVQDELPIRVLFSSPVRTEQIWCLLVSACVCERDNPFPSLSVIVRSL